MHLRRLALASLLVGGIIGAFVQFGVGNFIPHKLASIEFSRLALGEQIGPLAFEGLVDRESQSLQLQSARCERSIFMTVSSVKNSPPEQYIAHLYPTTEWRTVYVYRGQAHDTFARVPALLRFLALRAMSVVTLSVSHLSDEFVFTFHVPVTCTLEHSAAIAASNEIIALAASSGR